MDHRTEAPGSAHASKAVQAISGGALALLLAITAIIGVAGAASPAGAVRTVRAAVVVDPKARPILFLHGYTTGSGENCASDWNPAITALKAQGFTGPFIKVGYYSGDSSCDLNLHSFGSYGDRDSWKTIAKVFSQYVLKTFTAKGVAVDLVGHSMGGLIARGAVYGAQKGESGFSAPIDVPEAVTLAAPHDGAAWYSYLCLWGQCSTLKPSAGDISWLHGNGNPQGLHGTDWTVTGSPADDVVPVSSALDMALPSVRRVSIANIEHSDEKTSPVVLARLATALAVLGQ